jgi:hypothetical protein
MTTVLKILEKKIRITMGSFMKATDSSRLLQFNQNWQFSDSEIFKTQKEADDGSL